ncbi:addiction module antidote protein [Solirhodobacter olei]|uniref:addiction module antidote protein n=1 Tax=Solirhodobacter olei TaxID=2493082 RepID=UPI000FDA5466|nr:addiction module antidote protein [Solirhodobacter olei]
MVLATTPFDAAEYLRTDEAQAEFLAIAFEEGDEGEIKRALATVARARGMTEIAKSAHVSRQALYKSLGPDGDPKLSTLLGVVKALGMSISIRPHEDRASG